MHIIIATITATKNGSSTFISSLICGHLQGPFLSKIKANSDCLPKDNYTIELGFELFEDLLEYFVRRQRGGVDN